LKAFIVAHDPAVSPADHLYVYSSQAPLQTIPLGAQAFDVTFPGNAMFGFLAGGAPGSSSFLPVCDSSAPPGVQSIGGAPGILIRQLPGNSMVVLDPPNLFRIDYSVPPPGPVSLPSVGCPKPPFGPAGGVLAPATTFSGPTSVGQGTFTPIAFNVSSDGQKAYILAAGVSSLIIYDIPNQTSTTIPLIGNPAPLAGALAPDGLSFYVTGSDNNLHVINLVSGVDVQQLSIPSNSLCAASQLPGLNAPTCLPDLLAVP
jgi:DNA-binding beta-propeller fold protein YncE